MSCVCAFTRAAVLLLVVSDALAQTSLAGRTQDLDFVQYFLPGMHADFFYQLNPATYYQAASALQTRIGSATDAEFYMGLAQLIAMAGDMHTTIDPEDYFYGYGSLPLTLRWLDDGLFVTAAAPEYSQTLGTQIVAVNGMPISQVVTLIGSAFAYANDQWLHETVQTRLPSLFVLEGLDIIPSSPHPQCRDIR